MEAWLAVLLDTAVFSFPLLLLIRMGIGELDDGCFRLNNRLFSWFILAVGAVFAYRIGALILTLLA